jgi:hypothetical protein
MKETTVRTGIRWVARVLAAVTVLFFGVMLLGHFFGGQETPPPPDVLIPILVMLVGFVLAWKWELVSGALAIAGYLTNVIRSPQLLTAWPYAVCLLTGVLFVVSAFLHRGRRLP